MRKPKQLKIKGGQICLRSPCAMVDKEGDGLVQTMLVSVQAAEDLVGWLYEYIHWRVSRDTKADQKKKK